MGTQRCTCVEYGEGIHRKRILVSHKRHVCNRALYGLPRCNQIVEKVVGNVDLDDGIPTPNIAWSQRRKEPRHLSFARSIPTGAKLRGTITLQSGQPGSGLTHG